MQAIMSTLKKTLIAILLLIIVGGLGYAVYWVFFRTPTTGPIAGVNANKPFGGLTGAGNGNRNGNLPVVPPPSGNGNLNAASPIAKGGTTVTSTLVSMPTVGAKLGKDGKTIRYYDAASGKFMYVDADGVIHTLSDQTFYNVQNVTWSADGMRIVMEFPDGSKLAFDFATQKQATLPASWSGFSFSPDSNQLVSKQVSDSEASRYLVVSNADGSGTRAIEPLGENADKVNVAWSPAGDVLALSQTGDAGEGFGVKQVLFIGKNGENFPSTEIDGLNFTPVWSPDGSYMLYSTATSGDDFRPRLWIVTGSGEARGSGRRKINLLTTADKCTFSDTKTVYCAVPDSVIEGAGMSPEVMRGVPDSFYKVNVTTGAIQLIGRPDTDTTVSSVTISNDGTTLFFTDQATGYIKKMMLK